MPDLAGKIALVTGATSGIGTWTAAGLAKAGATVVITARDRARGEAVQRDLAAQAPGARIELLIADLASLAEVRRLAAEIKQRYQRLDILINNAGLMADRRELTVDGFEKVMAVNYLAPFLLTLELIDLVKRSAPARIVNVGSTLSDRALIDLDDLQSERRFTLFGAYAQSKLALLLFTVELARRLEGSNVAVNVVHPGGVATNILRLSGWLGGVVDVLRPVLRLALLSPEAGAKTTLHVALAPELASVSGRYFKPPGQEAAPNPVAGDRTLTAALWQRSLALTGGAWL
jgi:NAD(P)-dependent dehydrogenase (short-subunit alcohol dehydrogenase family)